MNSFNSITKLNQYRHSSIFAHQLFSLPIWGSLTLLPYRKASSRIIDRLILASEGAING